MRLLRVVVVVLLLLWPASVAADAQDVVEAVVPGDTGESHAEIRCGGTAPLAPGCVGQMTLLHDFNIRLQLSFSYRGYLTIHGFTETGSTTVFCDWVLRPGQPCDVARDGTYFEGQVWTMVVAATGVGFWSVTAG